MNNIPLDDLLETAVAAAKAAGMHALKNKSRRFERHVETTHDVKLVLDIESQHVAENHLSAAFPDHAFFGEESEEYGEAAGYQWIIDPIDGTVNFSHGFPYWCCSIAVRYKNEMLAGCIYAPEFDACYTAHIETVAKKNGTPIHVSATEVLSDALLFTGLSPNMETPGHAHLDAFKQLVYKTRKVRINGSAALDLCQLAEGKADGYFEAGLHLWDYAAALLIAQQAGSKTEEFPHSESALGARILCSNGPLHDGMMAIYRSIFE